ILGLFGPSPQRAEDCARMIRRPDDADDEGRPMTQPPPIVRIPGTGLPTRGLGRRVRTPLPQPRPAVNRPPDRHGRRMVRPLPPGAYPPPPGPPQPGPGQDPGPAPYP